MNTNSKKVSVTDLISPGHIFTWLFITAFFPPWFVIHPILVLIIYHKRQNEPLVEDTLDEEDDDDDKVFVPLPKQKREPIPQSHWDSINAYKQRMSHENQD